MVHLRKVHDIFGDRIHLVSVAVTDTQSVAMRAAKEWGMTWDVLIDDIGEVGPKYGVNGIPKLVLIDSKGRIVESWDGAKDDELIAAIEKVI